MPDLPSLIFTTEFVDSLFAGRFSAQERAQIRAALILFDANEKHPSLRIHRLHGDMQGKWTAYAWQSLRSIFERTDDGRKRVLEANRHYGD